MSRILFAPVSILGGVLAGLLAKAIFEWIWKRVDDQEPPAPEHRQVSLGKMAVALLLEGAIFRLVRGAFDHGARSVFYRGTHRWPGEPRPEPD